ncbi:MAG: hypothetical protein J3K34DRAFT_37604 [Monoraphidium minutum]|nr:MAG: hypothetical protein J3K34DRAFT_37604 [Monoraphidium minutum]
MPPPRLLAVSGGPLLVMAPLSPSFVPPPAPRRGRRRPRPRASKCAAGAAAAAAGAMLAAARAPPGATPPGARRIFGGAAVGALYGFRAAHDAGPRARFFKRRPLGRYPSPGPPLSPRAAAAAPVPQGRAARLEARGEGRRRACAAGPPFPPLLFAPVVRAVPDCRWQLLPSLIPPPPPVSAAACCLLYVMRPHSSIHTRTPTYTHTWQHNTIGPPCTAPTHAPDLRHPLDLSPPAQVAARRP